MAPSTIFLAISSILSILFLFYGFNQYYLLFLSAKYRTPRQQNGPSDDKPKVAIHLPIYDEKYVVSTLISACFRTANEYGLDKVRVVIIDDSDDETVQEIDKVASDYHKKGLRVDILRRGNRTGFKAGALQAALDATEEEFIAVFDADFVPAKDFLTSTIPYLTKDKKLGVVQSRWTHLNRQYNFMTQAIAIGIDVHFLIEQPARYEAGFFQNFNGSGGLLRAEAIRDAGGWQSDTLAEDLDLSYRMQLAGYHILYLKNLHSCGEIPPTVPSYKKQQARWANGSLRTAKKLVPKLLRKDDIGIKKKIEGVLHLTNYLLHPLMFTSFLLACLAVILQINSFNIPQVSIIFSSLNTPEEILRNLGWFTVGGLIISATLAAWISPMIILHRQGISILKNIPSLFTLFLLGFGLSLSNTIEAGKALFTNRIWSFHRTPKYNLTDKNAKWEGKSYQVEFNYEVFSELLFACLGATCIGLALVRDQWAILLILVPYTIAYGFVFLFSILQSGPSSSG